MWSCHIFYIKWLEKSIKNKCFTWFIPGIVKIIWSQFPLSFIKYSNIPQTNKYLETLTLDDTVLIIINTIKCCSEFRVWLAAFSLFGNPKSNCFRAEVFKHFSVKGHIVDIFVFEGHPESLKITPTLPLQCEISEEQWVKQCLWPFSSRNLFF